MKILFLNAYFYPERIAFSHLEQDIMEGLVRAGHRLSVICPTPSRGVTTEEIKRYRKKKTDNLNGVTIQRFRTPGEGSNPLVRAFRYFWCHFRGDMLAKRMKDIDAIFAVSTPPTQGYFAGKVAKKLGVPLIYSIQDLFPDSLVTTGMTQEGSVLYRIGARIERKTYDRSAKLIVLSDTVKQNLLSKGVEEKKLCTVNNWIDTDAVAPVRRADNRLFDEFNVSRDAFVVVYAGNFGASQGAQVILEAARLLRENREIRFVIFGGGAEYEKAADLAADLQNVTIHPLLPFDRVGEVYSMGDVALITCKKGVSKTGMPSKTWNIMACDTPIIASFDTDSELAGILKKAGAGICVEPEDAAALAGAIKTAYDHRKSGEKKPSGSREYVIKNASKTTCVNAYVACIEDAVR